MQNYLRTKILHMHLASLAKIKTAKHSLIRLRSGELAYITKRFDRNRKGRIAMEDFCQLSENLTEHKYRAQSKRLENLHTSTLPIRALKYNDFLSWYYSAT